MGKDKDRSKYSDKSDSRPGRIGILDEHTIGYYRRISETLKETFESNEEKELFVNNVFAQLSTEVLKVSQNQTVSRIVEDLLLLAGRSHLTSVFTQLSNNWEQACCDRFASFVTQSTILRSNQYLDEVYENNAAGDKSLEALLDELCAFLVSQLALHMQHTYASHIIRVIVEVLAGTKVSEMIIRSKLSRDSAKGLPKDNIKLKRLPPRFSHKLYDICSRVADLKKLGDHVRNNLSSPVLQTILLASKSLDDERRMSVCQRILSNADIFHVTDGKDIADNVTHEIGSHLVEQFLITAPDETFSEVFTTHFNGHLLAMARHPVANYVLQSLITNLRTSEQFGDVFTELSPNFEAILAFNHLGVIVRIAEGCVKHGTKQKKFIKSLCKAFHCYKPAERRCKMVPLLASLTTYETFYGVKEDTEEKDNASDAEDSDSGSDSNEKSDEKEIKIPSVTGVNYHGSVILQNLLRFGNPKPVVSSLFEFKPAELRIVCNDSSGSHIIEAFTTSETVGEKSRELLYNKMKGQFVDLACDKSGSRTFDSLWNAAPMKQKCLMADELLQQEERLKGSKFGFFVHSRCALRNYKQRPSEWKEMQGSAARKRKQLQEVIQESTNEKSQKIAKR